MGETDSRGIALSVRGKKRLLGDGDLGAVLQLLEATVGDYISGVESLHRGRSRFSHSWRDVMNVRDAVLNKKDVGGLSIVLDGRGRNQDLILQGIQQQAGVHEQIREKRVVFVVEDCAQFQRCLLYTSHVILVQLGINHRHFGLAKCVVEGCIERLRGESQAGRGGAVISQQLLQAAILLVGIHILKAGEGLHLTLQYGSPFRQVRCV